MTPSTPGPRTVQLVESDDNERQALQELLELVGLRVEGFASLAERAPGSGECLLWSIDGPSPQLDDVLRETSKGTSVVSAATAPGSRACSSRAKPSSCECGGRRA